MFVTSTPPINIGVTNVNFYSNLQYGRTNREVFDIFIPIDEVSPTGLVINVHGGGFIQGDKSDYYDTTGEAFIQDMLSSGIACASTNYDLLETDIEGEGVISPLTSFQKVIKYIKFYANSFNIDKTKIILKGNSGGAGAAMWVGYGEDRIEPEAPNLIDRESTSVAAISLTNPQATYDLHKWETVVLTHYGYKVLPDYNNNEENRKAFNRFYGVDSYNKMFNEEYVAYRKDVDMLQMILDNGGISTWINSKNKPEGILVNYTLIDLLHNSLHGERIREYLLAKGTEVISNIRGRSGDMTGGETEKDFIKRHI